MSIDLTLTHSIPHDRLTKIRDLVATVRHKELALAAAEAMVKDLKEQIRVVREEQLPDVLDSAGVSTLTLDDGTELTLGPLLLMPSLGQGSSKLQPVLSWLRTTGHDGIILQELAVAFGKGTDAQAGAVRQALEKQGFAVETRTTVRPQTFKALVRECLEEGQPVPLDELGIYAGRTVTIKQEKQP